MEKTGNSTVLMLGVAGMGLSLAMFIDAMKMKSVPNETPEKYTEDITEDITEDVTEEHFQPLEQLYTVPEETGTDVLSVPSSETSSNTSSNASSKAPPEELAEKTIEENELVQSVVRVSTTFRRSDQW